MFEFSRTTIEMARCFKDRREALSLIHSAHVLAGLPSRSENALRVTRHQLLPRSRIFVAKADGRVVSTLSLMPDSPAGLPLDSLCGPLLDRARERGWYIAELGCFADRRQQRGKLLANYCGLLRYTAQYALAQGIDCLVIGSHFGRERFLKKYLGFRDEVFALRASRSRDDRAPAPLFLEFERLRVESPEKYQAYFGEIVPAKEFSGGFMPRWEADYFSRPGATETCVPATFSSTAEASDASPLSPSPAR